jgi:hypothetical protein
VRSQSGRSSGSPPLHQAFADVWREGNRLTIRDPEGSRGEVLSLDDELAALTDPEHPRPRPRLILAVNPHGSAVPRRWAELSRRCREAGVSFAAVVPRAESLPGAWFALPSRLVPPAVAPDPGRPDLTYGGNIHLLLRNLDALAPDKIRVQLHAHADPSRKRRAGFNGELLKQKLASAGWRVIPEAAGVSPGLRLELAGPNAAAQTWNKLPAPDRDASRRHTSLLLWPGLRADVLTSWTEGLEATLLEGDRPVARAYRAVEITPPRVFYLPLAAALPPVGGKDDGWWPALPQDPDARGLGLRSRSLLPWNLLWPQGETGGAGPRSGLTLWWPEHRAGALPARAGDAAPPKERYEALRKRGAITDRLPTAAEVHGYRAIILDASVPEGIRFDFAVGPRATGNGPFPWEGNPVHYCGGFLLTKSPVNGKPVPFHDGKELHGWIDSVLKPYLDAGGTLMLLGASRHAWEDTGAWKIPNAEVFNFRDVLARLGRSPGPASGPPRRIALGYEWLEGSTRKEASRGAFPTLPDGGSWYEPVDATEARRQLFQDLGFAVEVKGKSVRLPGVSEMRRWLEAGLGLGGEAGQAADPELGNLLDEWLFDSQVEFSAHAVRWLAGVLTHPELDLDLQGRPFFHRAYPAQDDLPDADRPWLFQTPFVKPSPEGYVVWRDRYRILLEPSQDKYKLPLYKPGEELTRRPVPNTLPLLDGTRGMNWLLGIRPPSTRVSPRSISSRALSPTTWRSHSLAGRGCRPTRTPSPGRCRPRTAAASPRRRSSTATWTGCRHAAVCT